MASGVAGRLLRLLRSTASGRAGLPRCSVSASAASVRDLCGAGSTWSGGARAGRAGPLQCSVSASASAAAVRDLCRAGSTGSGRARLHSTASGRSGPHSAGSGGGSGGPLPHSVGSGARLGHNGALLATVSVVTAVTLLLNERASASSGPDDQDTPPERDLSDFEYLFEKDPASSGPDDQDTPPERYFRDFEKPYEKEVKLELPESVDWELLGAVNVPNDQGNCGSCWAHAGVGAVEAIHFIVYGKLLRLSVQSVIDCSIRGYKIGFFSKKVKGYKIGWGCDGGNSIHALEYAIFKGLTTEELYPLRPILGHWFCSSSGKEIFVTTSNWAFTGYGEKGLMAAVAKQPVVVSMDPYPVGFTYNGGIIEFEDWKPLDEMVKDEAKRLRTRHAVLVVGYGTDSLGRKFWKVKNSHGVTWGDRGYFYLRRGVEDFRGVGGVILNFLISSTYCQWQSTNRTAKRFPIVN